MASTGSTGLDELSRTLRLLRSPAGERGLTLAEAAKRTGFSTAKISRIERGKNIPSPDDVIKFAEAYRVTPDARERLATLAIEVKAANRRVVLTRRANRAEFQDRMRRIEASSEQLREFSPIIVPGYLQTAEYMRAIFLGSGTTPEDAERAVANRLLRQAALDEPGRRITILMTEGALGWAAGPPAMMVRQMEHIEVVTRKPCVRVGIIPFGVPRNVFPVSNWNLYDERVVVPGILRQQVVLVDSDVKPYVDQFAELEPLAVFDDEARTVLARAAAEYRRMC